MNLIKNFSSFEIQLERLLKICMPFYTLLWNLTKDIFICPFTLCFEVWQQHHPLMIFWGDIQSNAWSICLLFDGNMWGFISNYRSNWCKSCTASGNYCIDWKVLRVKNLVSGNLWVTKSAFHSYIKFKTFFCKKSIFVAPEAFIFGTKQKTITMLKLEKFYSWLLEIDLKLTIFYLSVSSP